MIGLTAAIIGYFAANMGVFGGDIVYALKIVENWYLFVFIFTALSTIITTIVAIVSTIVLLVAFVSDNDNESIVSSVHNIDGLPGMFLVMGDNISTRLIIFVRTIMQLWCTHWLIGCIDPMASAFNMLTTSQLICISGLVVVSLIPSRFYTVSNKQGCTP